MQFDNGSKTPGTENAFIRLDTRHFTPRPGFLLVSIDATPEKSGAIHLVRKGKEELRRSLKVGCVEKRGAMARTENTDTLIPWNIQVGDDVILDAFAGHDVEGLDGNYYVICDESAIVAVIEEGIELITEAIA